MAFSILTLSLLSQAVFINGIRGHQQMHVDACKSSRTRDVHSCLVTCTPMSASDTGGFATNIVRPHGARTDDSTDITGAWSPAQPVSSGRGPRVSHTQTQNLNNPALSPGDNVLSLPW